MAIESNRGRDSQAKVPFATNSLGESGHNRGIEVLGQEVSSDPLRRETHQEILRFMAILGNGDSSRKIPVNGTDIYSEAIEANAISPSLVDARTVLFPQESPAENYESWVDIDTFGESWKYTNPNPQGGRTIAEAIIYVGPDEEHDLAGYGDQMGKLRTEVHVTDQHTITYAFDVFEPAGDEDVAEALYMEYDKWGIPRPSGGDDHGDLLTEDQAIRFLRALRMHTNSK